MPAAVIYAAEVLSRQQKLPADKLAVWVPAGIAQPVPLNCTHVEMVADRTDMLSDSFDPTFEYGFEVSLDGGATWPATVFSENKTICYSLRNSVSTFEAEAPAELGQDSRNGAELPQPANAKRWVRGWYRSAKPYNVGLRFEFFEGTPTAETPLPEHNSVTHQTSAAAVTYATAASKNFSITPSGSERWLNVGNSLWNFSGTTGTPASTAVFNTSETMADLGQQVYDTVKSVQMFGLPAPTATTADVVITFNGTGFKYGVCGGSSYNGVHQTVPVGTAASATGNSTAPSVSVTTTSTDNMVVDCVGAVPALTAAQTQNWNGSETVSGLDGASQRRTATGGSDPMAWTISSSPWGIIAIEIKAAGGGGGAVIGTPMVGERYSMVGAHGMVG